MSCRKRLNSDAKLDTDAIMEYTHKKKKQMIYKFASSHTTPHNTTSTGSPQARDASFIPTASGIALYREEEVTALLHNQEQIFRAILEEKLREQFNTIFKEYKNTDVSYIN